MLDRMCASIFRQRGAWGLSLGTKKYLADLENHSNRILSNRMVKWQAGLGSNPIVENSGNIRQFHSFSLP